MIKKKERSKKFLKENTIFECPICNEDLICNYDILKCINNHTFDIKKNGALFLINTNKYKESKYYNRNFFLARREFIKNGYYNSIYEFISKYINHNFKKKILILDLGCGEFSHTAKICDSLNEKNVRTIGIDYSKSAIDLATDYLNEKNIFLVGDITNLPLKNKSVDVIINFLSPFNENEVKRVLTSDGIFVKIVPTKNYLKELRNIYGIIDYKKEIEVLNNLKEKFDIIEEKEIKDNIKIKTEKDKKYLLNMTPLTWNEKHLNVNEINNISISLKVLILKGKKI